MYNVLPTVKWSSVFVFVVLCCAVHCFVSILVCNHLEEEEKVGCFAVFVFQMYCYSTRYMSLSHSAMDWSAVCDCSIS